MRQSITSEVRRDSQSTKKATSRAISRNSFLISLVLNLSLILILSLYRELEVPQSRDAVVVRFVSLPETRLHRRSLIAPPRALIAIPRAAVSARVSVRITKEVASSRQLHSNSAVPIGIEPTENPDPNPPSASTVTDRTHRQPTGDWRRGDSVPSRPTRSGFGGRAAPSVRRIVPRQPKAIITGSSDEPSGYYNISLVKYEDTSDVISPDALTQLAGAMNRWTQIRTKVIKEPIKLDDPELLQVPLVYITSRRPFAFSERERENLQKYLAGGGFLLFSNAVTDAQANGRGVANSIEFELWKVLGEAAHDLVDIGKEHPIYSSFFDPPSLPGLRGVVLDGRIRVIYEDAGYGRAWIAAKDSSREPYLKLGVNIIIYALATSPLVQELIQEF